MATSLYDMSVPSYLQLLGGMANVMQKGADYYAENNMDLDDIVSTRLRDDMAPFTFQIISVKHHSLGAIEGLERGEFNPPPTIQGLDYAGLQGLVQQAISTPPRPTTSSAWSVCRLARWITSGRCGWVTEPISLDVQAAWVNQVRRQLISPQTESTA